ncbi:MFS transporter [Streptacidiphilus sp. N1-12]|uniref:MFS transporter n=2 Tax=Streptacidiphilus alkalitolerans TaxID=3342712 RepID=A0ABV6V7Y7_9ACTN
MADTELTRPAPTPTADTAVHSSSRGAAPPSGAAVPIAGTARPGLLLGLILTGQFMAVLDVFIVNVAAPVIRTDLHTSGSALQLIIAGYTIAYAVLLITGARLGERHGFSRVFQLGVAGFTLASLACGLAPTAGALIGFRVLQGVGAALMVPQVMSLIQRTFTGAARLRALGAYTAVLAGAGVVGQVLGGVLVGADLFGSGWRPAFLVNVPIGIVLLLAGRKLLPVLPGNRGRSLDLLGLVVLAGALGLLVVPLVMGHEEHWPLWGWLMLGASALLFALFGLVEQRIAARGGSPLIHARVLRAPGLLTAGGAIFLTMATVSGFMFAMAMHVQAGLGLTPLRAGLVFLPLSVGFGISGMYWQRLPRRLHVPLPAVALALCGVGYLGLGLLLRNGSGVGFGVEALMLPIGLIGGCAYGPLMGRALARVAPSDASDASGVVITMIQLGTVLGVATLGTLFLGEVSYPAPSRDSGHALFITTLGTLAALLCAALLAARTRRLAAAGA